MVGVREADDGEWQVSAQIRRCFIALAVRNTFMVSLGVALGVFYHLGATCSVCSFSRQTPVVVAIGVQYWQAIKFCEVPATSGRLAEGVCPDANRLLLSPVSASRFQQAPPHPRNLRYHFC